MLVLVVDQVVGQKAINAPGSVCIMLKFALLGFLCDAPANYRVVHLVLVLQYLKIHFRLVISYLVVSKTILNIVR